MHSLKGTGDGDDQYKACLFPLLQSAHRAGLLGARCLCTQPPAPGGGAAAAKPAEKAAAPPPPLTPPPLPPVEKSGGGVFWKLLGLTVVGLGGATGYAWYDANFRKQIETNVPYSKDYFDALFQYYPPTQSGASSTPAPVKPEQGLARVIKPDIPSGAAAKPVPEPQVAKTIEPAVTQAVVEKTVQEEKPKVGKDEAKPAKPVDEKKRLAEEKRQREAERVKQALRDKEAEEAAENMALERILGDVSGEVINLAQKAMEAQKSLAEATRAHTKKLKEAMDNVDPEVEKEKLWEAVTAAHELKKEAVEACNNLTSAADEAFEKLRLAIKDGKSGAITKKNKAIVSAEEKLNKMSYDLKTAVAEVTKADSEANMMREYRSLVQKGKEQFKKELESIMPDVKLGSKRGRMTEEELNSLIAHAHRRIEQLQRHLAEQQALEQARMQTALEKQQEADEKIADGQLEREKERLFAHFEVEKQKIETERAVQFELELRQQLMRQAGAHSDHLAEVLRVQEAELHSKYERLMHEKVSVVRDDLRGQIKNEIAKLRGIEQAVEGRAEMERLGRKAQELWLACQTLFNIIENGAKPNTETWEEQMKPLRDELVAIREAGNNHPFVEAILEAVPEEAAREGVYTQEALQDRFDVLRRVCRRVAMIDETGGTLFRYFVSYLQSLLVFTRKRPYTDSDTFDPKDLDAFTLLDNAAHCLEKGDLEQALRYVNQLKGEPANVAKDWVRDARLLLETRQAADALLAHASAAGLGNLF